MSIKSLLLGMVLGGLLVPSLVMLVLLHDQPKDMIFNPQLLPTGQTVKVLSFYLVWGVEHSERHGEQDSFQLEYKSALAHDAPYAQREQEAWQVFALIQPVSEQWRFKTAALMAFPSLQRKGRYDQFFFTRAADGRWTLKHQEAKVHINDA